MAIFHITAIQSLSNPAKTSEERSAYAGGQAHLMGIHLPIQIIH